MKRWTMVFAASVLIIGAALAFQRAEAITSAPAKPDLIVDQKRLLQNWVVRDEKLSAEACSVQEGGITPGEHRLVRFTVSTPNIGTADLVVGDPNVHFNNGDGLFEFASCHRHFHFRHYSLYELIDPATGHTWRAAKRGFCMIDIEKFQEYPGPANNERNYLSCGAPATATRPSSCPFVAIGALRCHSCAPTRWPGMPYPVSSRLFMLWTGWRTTNPTKQTTSYCFSQHHLSERLWMWIPLCRSR